MNKKIALTASIFATSITATNTFAAGTFETWNGADSFYRVETGLGNQTDTYGLWFTYGDDGDGGTSTIIWDMPLNPEYTEDALAPIIDECKGVCGTAHLGKGTLTYAPFVGAGFLVVGETSETDQTIAAGDASSWGGLCVTYTSDIDLQLELGLGETMDSTINYANPAVTLPAAKSADIPSPNGTNGNKVVVSWSDFKQPTSYNGTVKFDGEQAAKQLVIVRFKMQADPGAYRFNICAVGPKDGTCPEKCGSSTTVTTKTFDTWNGADYAYQVQTGLGNETETNGYWFKYDDGISNIDWHVYYEFPWEFIVDPIVERCGGLCGTANIGRGTSTSNSYVGFGFNIVGETSTTNNTPAAGDASAWGGLCVTYTSDVDLQLELGLGEKIDSTINYANPAVTLPAAKEASILPPKGKNGNKVIVSWSDFKQPSWYNGSVKFDGETAAKQLVNIRFKLQAEPGDYDFNICAVGPKDGICPEECGISSEEMRIPIARGVATAKAILVGRTLGFTGVSHASAEVMNSLGQVVARGAINSTASTLNLAHLDAGIYMVRVVGKSANFTNKIVLK